MSKYQYHFETFWSFESNIEPIWALISGVDYEKWWISVSTQQLKKGSCDNGVGAIYKTKFKTKLPYDFTFTSELVNIESPHLLELKVFGELEGKGTWHLSQKGSVTHVHYTWQVNTKKKWMNVLTPLLRPIFVWNHNQVMREGANGIAYTLGVKIVSS